MAVDFTDRGFGFAEKILVLCLLWHLIFAGCLRSAAVHERFDELDSKVDAISSDIN